MTGKKKPQQNAQQSFQQLVAMSSWKNIEGHVTALIETKGDHIQSRLARQQIAAQGEIISRIAALENVLIAKGLFTREELVEATFDVEDDAQGMTRSDAPAAPGDMVRITYRTKLAKDASYSEEQRQIVRRVVADNTLIPAIAEGIVGMTAGQEKEIPFSVTNKVQDDSAEGGTKDATTDYLIKVKVDRVSLYPKKPETSPETPKAEEGANAEG